MIYEEREKKRSLDVSSAGSEDSALTAKADRTPPSSLGKSSGASSSGPASFAEVVKNSATASGPGTPSRMTRSRSKATGLEL